MPKIKIREDDRTLTGVAVEELANIVYIPGFSTAAINPAAGFDEYVPTTGDVNGVPAGIPKLCSTLEQFQAYFGSEPATFATDQAWPNEFDGAAKTDAPMFLAGDYDPSYIYAYDLIANGIPIVYERLNAYGSENTLEPYNATTNPNGYKSGATLPTSGSVQEVSVGQYYVVPEVTTEAKATDSFTLYACTAVTKVVNGSVTTYTYSFDKMTDDAHVTKAGETTLNLLDIVVTTAYAKMSSRFDSSDLANPLMDMNKFDIKYLTSGGYPTFEYNSNAIAKKMINVAEYRGDCIALIDHTDNSFRNLVGSGSVIESINGTTYTLASTYAAMCTPWVNMTTTFKPMSCAPSFALLRAISEAVKTSSNWLAAAGVTRGVVPNANSFHIDQPLVYTTAIANSYTDQSQHSILVNPFANVRPYGITVWGNRTLAQTSSTTEKASYFFNQRSMVTEIKKVCYAAAESLMFEQNSDILWINFKAKVVPLLDQLKSSYGISGYKIVKETASSKRQLKATITIAPIYAVEEFDINIILTNEDVDVTES